MQARDISWTIAFCASLIAHVLFVAWRADRYVAEHTPLRLDGHGPISMLNLDAERSPLQEEELGDASGTGYAADASTGDVEMLARKGEQDQTFLSRDPEGPGQVGAPPSQSVVPPGENGENGSAAAVDPADASTPFGVRPTPQASSPTFKAPAAPVAAAPPVPDGPGSQPRMEKPPQQIVLAMVSPPPSPPLSPPVRPSPPTPQNAQAAAPATPMASRAGRPGPNTPAADPAPQGDSESDPFAIVGSLEFRKGSTKIRMGRKHKITRPRLSWDTAFIAPGMMSASVTLELRLDETGQVVSATVVKSSGSESFDQPCRLAAYEWWFEPAKDAAGHPIRDVIQFTIKFF